MTHVLATLVPRARLRHLSGRVGRPVTALAVAALLAACEGGSGQSGSAFVFLSVDGFSLELDGSPPTASVTSSNNPTTTTTACVTLRNNLKNPTLTASTALDNVIIQSYTVTLTAVSGGVPGPFTFGTAVLVPAGAVANNVVSGNTATFPIILVPAGGKGSPGNVANAQVPFRGRDGRGNSVQTEGAVTVLFVAGGTDSTCGAATVSVTNGTGGATT